MPGITFIAWVKYQHRVEVLSQHLGATRFFILRGKRGSRWYLPLAYLQQFVETLRILHQEKPQIILVQNPPIFTVIPVYLYCLLFKSKFAIDSHTSAFTPNEWGWSMPLHRWLSRSALLTIVHNEQLGQIVEGWGCRYAVLGEYPGKILEWEDFPVRPGYNVAVISSFAPDEPLDRVFHAAQQLPEVNFYVTGDAARMPPAFVAIQPSNIHLTGFLPKGQYFGLLRSADAVLALTTRDGTILSGANEAISTGVPLIVSDWPLLRSLYSGGTVYVSNTAEGILQGVIESRERNVVLRGEMQGLQARLLEEWDTAFMGVKKVLDEACSNGRGKR